MKAGLVLAADNTDIVDAVAILETLHVPVLEALVRTDNRDIVRQIRRGDGHFGHFSADKLSRLGRLDVTTIRRAILRILDRHPLPEGGE